ARRTARAMNLWHQLGRGAVAVAIVACAWLAGSCGAPQKASDPPATNAELNPPAGLGLQSVTLPDVSKMERSVRQPMATQVSSLKSAIAPRTLPRNALAEAYGETGKLLMAATLLDAAGSCFLNAQVLAPNDRRWPYYLGHVYQGKGPIERAAASFERAQQLAP